ncbi:hypothetical protein ACNSZH_26715 [Burkholderia gladioli]|uniref:hypothetical protein n=1 Tax=Burkholderia gladioli TaxID=28095 RepID=UPI003B98097C
MSQTQRSVSSLSAWYFGVRLSVSDSRPDAPLHGDEMNTQCGCSWPAAARTSAAVASRQPAGGGAP